MKSFLIAIAAVIVVSSVSTFVRAADDDDKKTSGPITGVLIDQMCGEKQMSKADPQKAAEKHPKDCCMKEGCAESGYAVISGKKMYKFDDNGNKLAKDYLAKSDNKTEVSVEGNVKEDGTIAVTDIKAAPAKS